MTTQNTAIVDKLLTNVSRKLIPTGYISEMILPVAQVKQTSGLLGFYGKGHLRIENDIVGGNTPYPMITTTTRDSDSYLITKHGQSDVITEEDYDNVEKPFDVESDTTEDLTTRLWTGKEKGLADALGSTSVITQNVTLAGTDQLNDYTNSDPIGRFKTARLAVKAASGVVPNLGVMSWEVFEVVKYNPDLLDLVKYTKTSDGGLGVAQMAAAMGVQQLLIGVVPYNSAVEGQTDSLANIWGKNINFLVAPKNPSKKQTTLGYRVQRKNPRRVFKSLQDNPPGSKLILVDDSYQFLFVDVTAAYLIKDAIA